MILSRLYLAWLRPIAAGLLAGGLALALCWPAAAQAKAPPAGTWPVGTSVEVEYSGSWYAATVLEARSGRWLVRYDGWGAEWDEWVEAARLRRPGADAAAAEPAASPEPPDAVAGPTEGGPPPPPPGPASVPRNDRFPRHLPTPAPGTAAARLPDAVGLTAILAREVPVRSTYHPSWYENAGTATIIAGAGEDILSRYQAAYGSFAGDGGIDTPEELFTALYLIPWRISWFEKDFNREFPAGREGLMRLAAAWLRAWGLDTYNAEGYEAGLDSVLAAAAKRGQGISRAEAEAWHAAATGRAAKTAFERAFQSAGLGSAINLPAAAETLAALWSDFMTSRSEAAAHRLDALGQALLEPGVSKRRAAAAAAVWQGIDALAGTEWREAWVDNHLGSYFDDDDSGDLDEARRLLKELLGD